jgi:hypothetical protein
MDRQGSYDASAWVSFGRFRTVLSGGLASFAAPPPLGFQGRSSSTRLRRARSQVGHAQPAQRGPPARAPRTAGTGLRAAHPDCVHFVVEHRVVEGGVAVDGPQVNGPGVLFGWGSVAQVSDRGRLTGTRAEGAGARAEYRPHVSTGTTLGAAGWPRPRRRRRPRPRRAGAAPDCPRLPTDCWAPARPSTAGDPGLPAPPAGLPAPPTGLLGSGTTQYGRGPWYPPSSSLMQSAASTRAA